MKKITSLVVVLILILSLSNLSVVADENIRVELNGQELFFDVQPQMINDRIMLPVRAIFEAVGAKVSWDEGTQTVTAVKPNHTVSSKTDTVKMTIGSTEISCATEGYPGISKYEMDVPMMYVDGRTLAPMRYVANSMSYVVSWYEEGKTAYIESPEQSAKGEYYTGTNVPTYDFVNFPIMLAKADAVIKCYAYHYDYAINDLTKLEDDVSKYCEVLKDQGWIITDREVLTEDTYIYDYSKDGITINIWVDKNFEKCHQVSVYIRQ